MMSRAIQPCWQKKKYTLWIPEGGDFLFRKPIRIQLQKHQMGLPQTHENRRRKNTLVSHYIRNCDFWFYLCVSTITVIISNKLRNRVIGSASSGIYIHISYIEMSLTNKCLQVTFFRQKKTWPRLKKYVLRSTKLDSSSKTKYVFKLSGL